MKKKNHSYFNDSSIDAYHGGVCGQQYSGYRR